MNFNKIYRHINNNKMDIVKSYKAFFFTSLISIFPLCIVLEFFLNLNSIFKKIEEQQIILALLFLVIAFLFVNMYFSFRISFFSFIKSRSSVYSLLIILGIQKKDFWKLIIWEYCFITSILGIICAVVSKIVSLIITKWIFKKYYSFSLNEIILNSLIIIGCILSIYIMIMMFTICIIIYKEKKNDVITLFEKLTQNNAKLYKHSVIYSLNPITGILLIIFSILLLINYSVGKMILAMFINSIGIFLIINVNGILINKFLRQFKYIYYKNIVKWNNLVYQYKRNAKVIYVIYILNFLLTFIIGGLIVSDCERNNNDKYPFEFIIYNKNVNTNYKDCYLGITINIKSIGKATAISISDYNSITLSSTKVAKGEMLYYRQKAAEEFSPLEGKDSLFIQNGDNYQEFTILEEDWQIIFGANIFSDLNTIVVLNNEDIMLLAKTNKKNTIMATNNEKLLEAVKLESYNWEQDAWFKSTQILKEKTHNNIINFVILLIGLVLIVENQALVMIRQILNEKEEHQQYVILNYLGSTNKELCKIQEDKVKNVLVLPEILGIIFGIFFFMADYFYQTQLNQQWNAIVKYMIVLISFGIIQYAGYKMNVYIIKKYYEKDIKVIIK